MQEEFRGRKMKKIAVITLVLALILAFAVVTVTGKHRFGTPDGDGYQTPTGIAPTDRNVDFSESDDDPDHSNQDIVPIVPS